MLYDLVLKPLPEVYNSFLKVGQAQRPISIAQYLDYNANADQFVGFALSQESSYTAGEETEPTRVTGARMTADFFPARCGAATRSFLHDGRLHAGSVGFGAVSLLLLLVALIASYLPTRRASKVDLIGALRCE